MRISIMQPYVFPYIGYFHLIQSSDFFVFYDDVNFIKKGWINRNRILLDNSDFLFSVPVSKASQNVAINQIELAINDHWRSKFYKTLERAYVKAPVYDDVFPLIKSVFDREHKYISDLAISSISSVYSYLDISFEFARSSIFSPETKGLDKADRLIEIVKKLGGDQYVNTEGGRDLYSENYFKESGVELYFLSSSEIEYRQFINAFTPSLSIIDVLMFNKSSTIKTLLTQYELVK